MKGQHASRVEFNYAGIGHKRYSRDLLDEWEDSMKGAIATDLIDGGCADEDMALKSSWLYGRACEEVIIELLFWVKWGHRRYTPHEDESKG